MFKIHILVLLFFAPFLCAQNTDPVSKKILDAKRVEGKINVDGRLDENDWISAIVADSFVTFSPVPGLKATEDGQIRVLFDNEGFYIGAFLADNDPANIPRQLSQRDEIQNTDWFAVILDTYKDGNNGLGFIVSASGVQLDVKYSVYGEDSGWDAVWESAVTFTEKGWIVEMKIPYSAIRFPKQENQEWHINFLRLYQRKQEKSSWSVINPLISGFLNQSGILKGIKNISSPIRLQATPFFAVYGQQYSDKAAVKKNVFGSSFNGGMDIKYGINDAFTLDMTLIPDFGEAQSDNQVFNLTPFEVRFDENRQFFTEGTELFNKGNIFYSRRIGGTPLNYGRAYEGLLPGETVINNPQRGKIVNATKISGRSPSGLGLGLFNATSIKSYAIIQKENGEERNVETDPLTNYNIFVLDQNLKHNSYLSFINTTVYRFGKDYDANVSAVEFDLRTKNNAYSLSGNGALSQKYFLERADFGHTYSIKLAKNGGAFTFDIAYNEESNTYDPKDLGFLFNNNERSLQGEINYKILKPWSIFNRYGTGIEWRYMRLYKPFVFNDAGGDIYIWGQTKKFWELNAWVSLEPWVTFDYFEPRTAGRFYQYPTNRGIGVFLSTDSRKPVMLTTNLRARYFNEENRNTFRWSIGPRWRISDQFNFSFSTAVNYFSNDVGYVNKVWNQSNVQDIIFGIRDISTVENVLFAAYNFSPTMSLTFRMRHYWSKVFYDKYALLRTDGSLAQTDYKGNHNANFNAFNIDMIYRWRFAPGSDLYVVWKNSILENQKSSDINYWSNLDGLFDNPQRNILSLKMIYFLDYNSTFRNNS